MYEKGIGEALEKLIVVLQLEGHEIFRIFTEVQPVMAMCNAIIVFSVILGGILSVVLLHKSWKKREWFHELDELEIGFMYVLVALVVALVVGLLSVSITDVYLHMNYPEYFAAKELISSLVS